MVANPSIATAYKTAVFRIHNPSRRKRAMLDDALTRNHRAYTKLLATLLPHIEHYATFRRGKRREGEIAKRAAAIVKPLPLSIGAKAGLANDVAGQISSHIGLREKQESPSLPTAARLNAEAEDWRAILERFAATTELEDETTARDRLLAEARAGKRRPALFLKNRVADGYLVLRSPEKGAYYVWLNLHSRDSRFARPVAVRGLVDVRTGAVTSFTSRTGALFPVEFGRDFHLAEFLSRARPQSAKLLERDGTYEVHVTFEFETPKIQPRCMLGVDRGIYNLASLAVVDEAGHVIEDRNVDGRHLRHVQRVEERRQRETQRRGRRYSSRTRRAMADEAVHTAANAIVDMAGRHGAQVVLEHLGQLTNRGRKRGRSNFNRVLNRSQYQKLQSVLDYKLAVAGLPAARTVSAAYTSQTCPICGHQDRENRPKQAVDDGFILDRFRCLACGHAEDADLNAARVIALKRMWREGLPAAQRPRRMGELSAEYQFRTYLRDRAATRDEGPGDRSVGTSGDPGLDGGGPRPAGQPAGSPDLARTPRRMEKSAAMPPRLSSSSENPPLPEGDSPATPGHKEHIG